MEEMIRDRSWKAMEESDQPQGRGGRCPWRGEGCSQIASRLWAVVSPLPARSLAQWGSSPGAALRRTWAVPWAGHGCTGALQSHSALGPERVQAFELKSVYKFMLLTHRHTDTHENTHAPISSLFTAVFQVQQALEVWGLVPTP